MARVGCASSGDGGALTNQRRAAIFVLPRDIASLTSGLAVHRRQSETPTMSDIHPFYQAHRATMEASLRARLEFADAQLRDRLGLTDTAALKQEIMAEFAVVLGQMPYVGGAESRMTDFFMRLLGFMAFGRVLRHHGVPVPVIREIGLASYEAQLLAEPEAARLAAGAQFMSAENRSVIKARAAESREKAYPDDFVYEFVEPGPGDDFDFGINYRECGFCKFAAKYGDQELLPNICSIDFAAYESRGIHLRRTQTLAAGASHCDFRFTAQTRPPAKA